MKQIIIIFLSTIVIFSCGENIIEEPDTDKLGYQFYPLSVGNEWVYQVDSSRIQGNNIIHSTSQVKEHIKELISMSGDDKVYAVERSYRKTSLDNWKVTGIWKVEKNDNRIIRTEENQKFIKLVFPNNKSTTWDGNVFFDDSQPYLSGADMIDDFFLDWKYKVTETDSTLQLKTLSFSDVIEVTHVNEKDVGGVGNKKSIEYFAPNVGLIKKDFNAFYSGTGLGLVADSIWLEKATKGLTFSQELISFKII